MKVLETRSPPITQVGPTSNDFCPLYKRHTGGTDAQTEEEEMLGAGTRPQAQECRQGTASQEPLDWTSISGLGRLTARAADTRNSSHEELGRSLRCSQKQTFLPV